MHLKSVQQHGFNTLRSVDLCYRNRGNNTEVKFAERKNALTQTQKAHKKILPKISSINCHVQVEKYSNGKKVFNTNPAATKRDTQGTSLELLWKREIA